MQLSVYSVPEGNGLVRVCAVLTGMTERSVLVDLQTIDGTAQGIFSTYIHFLTEISLYFFTLSVYSFR